MRLYFFLVFHTDIPNILGDNIFLIIVGQHHVDVVEVDKAEHTIWLFDYFKDQYKEPCS